MEKKYLLSEAKAKFGEMIRAAKAGMDVVLVERNIPIYRLVPYEVHETPESLLKNLKSAGAIIPGDREKFNLKKSNKTISPGALKRFLEDRNQ